MSITLNGTIPGSSSAEVVIIDANGESGPGGILKFKFSAPQAGAYTFNFCIGPASNPCGEDNDYVVSVPEDKSGWWLSKLAFSRRAFWW